MLCTSTNDSKNEWIKQIEPIALEWYRQQSDQTVISSTIGKMMVIDKFTELMLNLWFLNPKSKILLGY
ncbi:hypothetical protein CI593_15885 [Fischerella thermalis CCMEE 5194]|nr:hypothetical protein CI593_15885 [Fischerella thermalis CCMEE 5194]